MSLAFHFLSTSWQSLVLKLELLVLLVLKVVCSYPAATGLMLVTRAVTPLLGSVTPGPGIILDNSHLVPLARLQSS